MSVLPQILREAWSPDERLQRQLARFPRRLRKRVRKVAMEHDYLADLAFTFPMALFAIAAQSRGRDASARARLHACAGAPLRAIAHELQLAMWLKKLPPEALIDHVPTLPMDPAFTRRIVNIVPKDVKAVGHWLRAVDIAILANSDAFALWLGKELHTRRVLSDTTGVGLLAAFAWHCERPALQATTWIKKPWHGAISLSDAASATDSWLTRLQFAVQASVPGVNAVPPRDPTAGAFRFHRLAWGRDVVAEGEAMDNCLETYAYDLRRGNQVWSIRQGATRVADLEIEFLDGARGMPRIVQLLGKGNDPAPDVVWRAAYRWLSRWSLRPTSIAVKEQPAVIDPGRWQELWHPYWNAKPDANVFPHDVEKVGDNWLSAQSSHVWGLNRLPELSN